MEKPHKSPSDTPNNDPKTSRHAARYLIVGITLAVFNFVTFTLIARLIIKNNDLLWISNTIATFFTAILAYLLHSKFTWKEREITKTAILKFIIWNVLLTFAITPSLTWLFNLVTPLYEFTFNIIKNLGLPFDYSFVESTGVFILVNIVIMVINFLFYDQFVFSKSKTTKTKPSPTPEF